MSNALDPAARRVEKQQDKARQNAAPPLNAPFPFVKTRFDPWFFDLEKPPPAPPAPG